MCNLTAEKTNSPEDESALVSLHKAPKRLNFATIKEPIELPNLLDVQTESFDWLIGNERWKEKVKEDEKNGTFETPHVSGLEEVFDDISPIENYAKTMQLTFKNPSLDVPKHTWQECKEQGWTYAAGLFVEAEFTHENIIKKQHVFMGDLPLQTPQGTFIISGAERVVVSQLVRSPGVYFDRGSAADAEKDKEVFSGRIIPSRGAWLEFEISKSGKFDIRVDRRKKVPVIVFLQGMGMSIEEIRREFEGYPIVLDLISSQAMQGGTPAESRDMALEKIAKLVRPNDSATPESGKILLDSFYFNHRRYDLARVGRYKIN
ncbi:MAG: DNA-directed RNA polymerase subunit beta, partial [Aeriscardovia sp.]|nr:DNA-directed RNA polymerase subunit beta [Aeriscardovia sp.]